MVQEEQIVNHKLYRIVFNTFMRLQDELPDFNATDCNYLLEYMPEGVLYSAVFRNIYRVMMESFAHFEIEGVIGECRTLVKKWKEVYTSPAFQAHLAELKEKQPDFYFISDDEESPDAWAIPLTQDFEAPLGKAPEGASNVAATIVPEVSPTLVASTDMPSVSSLSLADGQTTTFAAVEGESKTVAAGDIRITTTPVVQGAAGKTSDVAVSAIPSVDDTVSKAPNTAALQQDKGAKAPINLKATVPVPEQPTKAAAAAAEPELPAVDSPQASLATPAIDDESTELHKKILSDAKAATEAVNSGEYDEVINNIDTKGMSALHFACDATVQDLALVEALIAHDADFDATDALGNTPLMYAAGAGKLDIVKVLIENGAATFFCNNYDFSAAKIAESLGFTEVSEFIEQT